MNTEINEIAAAIASAIGDVKQLGKSERNKFDGYDFVSIDKFLTLVNPICAKNGLFPIVSQTAVEMYENTNSKGGKSTWARFFYNINLYHASGQTVGPAKMMVAVPMNGAQASGSAQSYALKQFFRATFMIPTGDKDDADLNATEPHNAPPATVSIAQFTTLKTAIGETDTDEAGFLKYFTATSLEQFPLAKYDAAIGMLEKKKAIGKHTEAGPDEGDIISTY